jgi:hypothetical protein
MMMKVMMQSSHVLLEVQHPKMERLLSQQAEEGREIVAIGASHPVDANRWCSHHRSLRSRQVIPG